MFVFSPLVAAACVRAMCHLYFFLMTKFDEFHRISQSSVNMCVTDIRKYIISYFVSPHSERSIIYFKIDSFHYKTDFPALHLYFMHFINLFYLGQNPCQQGTEQGRACRGFVTADVLEKGLSRGAIATG